MAKKVLTAKEKADKLQAMYDRNNAYAKEKYRAYSLRFDRLDGSDIIQKLDSVPNKNDYIASLIRADIVKNGIE